MDLNLYKESFYETFLYFFDKKEQLELRSDEEVSREGTTLSSRVSSADLQRIIRSTVGHAIGRYALDPYCYVRDHEDREELISHDTSALFKPWTASARDAIHALVSPSSKLVPSARSLYFSPGALEFRRSFEWSERFSKKGFQVMDLGQENGLLSKNPVFVGHSLGGFVAYALAIVQKGEPKNREVLQRRLQLDVSGDDLARLGETLRENQALFLAMGTPYNGMETNFLWDGLCQGASILGGSEIQKIFEEVTCDYLRLFYSDVGLSPVDVLDGIVVGERCQVSFQRNGSLGGSLPALPLYLGMNLVGGFSRIATNNHILEGVQTALGFLKSDGVVPFEAADVSGLRRRVVDLNHWELVEKTAGAEAILAILEELTKVV